MKVITCKNGKIPKVECAVIHESNVSFYSKITPQKQTKIVLGNCKVTWICMNISMWNRLNRVTQLDEFQIECVYFWTLN